MGRNLIGAVDFITLANEANFDFDVDAAFSFSIWIEADPPDTVTRIILSKGDDQSSFSLLATDTLSAFRIETDARYQILGSVNNNNWVHYVCTFDGTSNRDGMKIYFNGALETTGTSAAMGTGLNNDALFLGYDGDTGVKFVGGQAFFTFWNVELTANQVAVIFRGSNVMYVRNDAIVANLWLNGNQDPEPDYSGGGNTGALTSAPPKFKNPPVELWEG